MKKALLVTENWPPRVGGIENYLTNIVEGLHNSGVETTVVAPRQLGARMEDRPYVVRRQFYSTLLRPRWLKLFLWIWRWCKRERPDVVLCGKALFEGLIGYYLKKYLGIRYAVFTYAMEIATWQKQSSTRRKLIRVLLAADAVFYINDQTKTALLTLGVDKGRLISLQPGVSSHHLKTVTEEDEERVRERYQLYQPFILSVARLIPRKGIDLLIEAYSQLDQTKFEDVQLVIVGDGPELEQLEHLVEKIWLDNSVIFLPDVVDDDLPALYKAAQVFALTPRVLPGDTEGFGIVYLEAAAQGTPAVATRSGGAPEAVVDGKTGLVVPPDDVAAITRALTTLLNDDVLRGTLGRQAQRRLKESFSWDSRLATLKRVLSL